ncbi:MAG TPA: hypothetical protein VFG31_02800 [Conexibacter sp.]|nr:hypothetical protein [Conexibacter sp.]
MTAVVSHLATITARWMRPGYVEWDPNWVEAFGRKRTKEPDLDDYGSFVRAELLGVATDEHTPGVSGVLGAIAESDGSLRVVFDPYAVANADPDDAAERVLNESLSRLTSACAKHGYEIEGRPAAW